MWKVEKSGSAFWAMSHYLNEYSQMSCVTSNWEPHQNTSGHCNTFNLSSVTAEADCHFHFAGRKTHLVHHRTSSAAADCVLCFVYLGHPWLRLQCCRAQCQSQCRGRCCGRGSGGLGRERSRFRKGLHHGVMFAHRDLLGLFDYSVKTLQEWINVTG